MKHTDYLDIKGRLRLQLTDRNGTILQSQSYPNAIVNAGRDLVAKQFYGVANIPLVSHIAVGTGGGASVDLSKNELESEIFRKAIAKNNENEDIIPSGPGSKARVLLSVQLDFLEANGPLTEAALLAVHPADSSNVTMYNRVIFPPVTKTEDFTLTLFWEIIF